MKKIQTYFAVLLTKKKQKNKRTQKHKKYKKTTTDYAILSKSMATLLAVQLLLQHSHQIKNKHKKASEFEEF